MKAQYVLKSLEEANKVLCEFLQAENIRMQFYEAVSFLSCALLNNLGVISCGNGGSMCDAMHFAEELTGRYRKDRRALMAMSVSDPSHLSCVANDFGYEEVFARQVEAFGKPGGVLLAISTSGNSQNVLNAAKKARSTDMKVVSLTGKDGGKLKELSDVCFVVPGKTTDRIQELHIKIIHILIEGIERELFPELYEQQ